jgi:hypothetical protein
MGYFHTTLVLFKKKKDPKSFLENFHNSLKNIGITLEKDEHEIIVFNDSRTEEEKEPIELQELMTDEAVLHLVAAWKGLGMLSYRHPDFRFAFSINYLTWDDEAVDGFDIGFYGKELKTKEEEERHQDIILEIGKLVDYEYIVGDIGNTSNKYIDLRKDLNVIKKFIQKNSFEIDIRP